MVKKSLNQLNSNDFDLTLRHIQMPIIDEMKTIKKIRKTNIEI